MKGFSLVELLVVIAVIAVLAVVATPAMRSVGAAQSITMGGNLLGDQIALARQLAAARNRNVEVRIVELSDAGEKAYRGVQLWIESADGSSLTPAGRLEILPTATAVAADAALSPLLEAEPNRAGTTNFGGRGVCAYKAFHVRPTGALDRMVGASNNFLTVYNLRDTKVPPQNFSTIRVNPATGRVTEYRP
jgi:uncharacterized protein (TIGR02596 family)